MPPDRIIMDAWNRVEDALNNNRMETDKTRAVFVGALYVAAVAIAINQATSREVSDTAHWIENQKDEVYK